MSSKRVAVVIVALALVASTISVLLSLRQVGGLLAELVSSNPPAAAQNQGDGGSPELVSATLPPLAIQAAPPDNALLRAGPPADSRAGELFPIPPESRCSYRAIWGLVVVVGVFPEIVDSPYPTTAIYESMPDNELRALADSEEDGFAQFVYAHANILGLPIWSYRDDVPHVSLESVLTRISSPEDEVFQTAQQYFIKSFQNHNWLAADRLSTFYFLFDKVEARAWALIAERAGGDSLARRTRGLVPEEAYVYTDYQKSASETRADELISEYDLASGLSPMEECL